MWEKFLVSLNHVVNIWLFIYAAWAVLKPRVKRGAGVFLLYFYDSMLRCKKDSSLDRIINFWAFIQVLPFYSRGLHFLTFEYLDMVPLAMYVQEKKSNYVSIIL